MRVPIVACLGALLVSVCPVRAQETVSPVSGTLAPYVGFGGLYTAGGEVWLRFPAGAETLGSMERQVTGAPLIGASLGLQVSERLSIFGSLARGGWLESTTGFFVPGLEAEPIVDEGGSIWFARLGIAVKLPQSPFSLSVGPGMLRTQEHALDLPTGFGAAINHMALVIGADGRMPLGSGRLNLVGGVDDYFTFWNNRELERGYDQMFETATDQEIRTSLTMDFSHVLVFRVGLSMSF